MALALDLTGQLAANKFINESHNVALEINRFIVPKNGAFYSKDLKVYNVADGKLLRPVVDYALYEPLEEIWRQVGTGVYKIIHVHARSVAAVRIDYQAVGGVYGFTAEQLAKEINGLLTGGSSTYPFGHVVGMPLGGLPPELHFEDARETYDAGKVVLALNHMVDAIKTGDRLGLSAVYQYINDSANDFHAKSIAEINAVNVRLDNLESVLDEGIGDIIISDNPTPPHVRLGYGQFQLSPDILLIGKSDTTNVGDLEGLAAGTDYYARRTHIWRQVEDLGQVSYQLSASANAINEGDSVTFTLQTTGLSPGTNVPYRITGTAGFNANDIAGTPLNGFFTVNAEGKGTVTVTATEDGLTEGVESFTLALTVVAGMSRTVSINDTSKSPTVAVRFSANANGSGSITQANEGTTAYLVITSSNLPVGHELNISYAAGSSTAANFVGVRPDTVEITGATTIIPYVIKADRETNGNRTLIPSLKSNIITQAVSATLTLIDTSKTPTHQMWFSKEATGTKVDTSMDEGQRVYLHLRTTEVDVGTEYSLRYTGTADDNDFNAARPNKITVGVGGAATVEYVTKNDFASEGNESFGVDLMSGSEVIRSANILILDTSTSPTHSAGFFTDAAGNNPISAANEGTTVYLVLRTVNVAQGTQFNVAPNAANTTVTAADFTTAIPTKLTVGTNGIASAALTIRNDYLTEGVEKLQLIISDTAGTQVATSTLTINDTSVNSTAVGTWSSSANGTPVITQANEGTTIYLHFTGANMPPNAKIDLTYPVTPTGTDVNDFTATLPANVTLNASGKGYVAYTLKNDQLREGDETFTVRATYGGVDVGTFAILIKDTSVPSLSAKFTASTSGAGSITSVGEGETFYMFLKGVGFKPGDSIVVNPSYLVGFADRFDVKPPSIVVLDNNLQAVFPIKIKEDMKAQGDTTLTISVGDTRGGDPSSGEVPVYELATASITVKDTSKEPSFGMVWSPNKSGTPVIQNTKIDQPGTSAYLVIDATNVAVGEEIELRRVNTDYIPDNFVSPIAPIERVRTVTGGKAYLELSTWLRDSQSKVWIGDVDKNAIERVDEGTDCYLYIQTMWDSNSNPWTNKRFYLRLVDSVGNATAADLGSALPTYVSWGGSGKTSPHVDSLRIPIKLDDIPESTERLAIEVNTRADFTTDTVVGIGSVDIIDKSFQEEIITVNTWTGNVPMNLMALYTQHKGAPTKPVNLRVVIGPDVTISKSEGADRWERGPVRVGKGWPVGSVLSVENKGKIYGEGGVGVGGRVEIYDASASGMGDGLRYTDYDQYNFAINGTCAIVNEESIVPLYFYNKGTVMSGGGGGGRGESLGWAEPIGTAYGASEYYSDTVKEGTVLGNAGSGAAGSGGAGVISIANPNNRPIRDMTNVTVDGAASTSNTVGADPVRPRWKTNQTGGSAKAGDVKAYALIRRSDNRKVWVVGGRGGKGGDAGRDGEPGTVPAISLSEPTPSVVVTPSDSAACAGGKAGTLTYGYVVFVNQGGIVRSSDYR